MPNNDNLPAAADIAAALDLTIHSAYSKRIGRVGISAAQVVRLATFLDADAGELLQAFARVRDAYLARLLRP